MDYQYEPYVSAFFKGVTVYEFSGCKVKDINDTRVHICDMRKKYIYI